MTISGVRSESDYKSRIGFYVRVNYRQLIQITKDLDVKNHVMSVKKYILVNEILFILKVLLLINTCRTIRISIKIM